MVKSKLRIMTPTCKWHCNRNVKTWPLYIRFWHLFQNLYIFHNRNWPFITRLKVFGYVGTIYWSLLATNFLLIFYWFYRWFIKFQKFTTLIWVHTLFGKSRDEARTAQSCEQCVKCSAKQNSWAPDKQAARVATQQKQEMTLMKRITWIATLTLS